MLRLRATTGSPRPRLAALASLCLALAAAAALAGPPTAFARHGGGERSEVRVAGSCGTGAQSELKLKAEDGGLLEAEFEVDQNRSKVAWRVVVTHESSVAWRGIQRTKAPSGSFTLRRMLPDFAGADTVSVRAWGPKGLTCRAVATLVASAE